MKGYSKAEWEFMGRHIEERLRSQNPEDGASAYDVLHSLKKCNHLLGKRVYSRPEILGIARDLGFVVGPREGSKYGHIWRRATA